MGFQEEHSDLEDLGNLILEFLKEQTPSGAVIRSVRVATLWNWDDMEAFFLRRHMCPGEHEKACGGPPSRFDGVWTSPHGDTFLVGCDY